MDSAYTQPDERTHFRPTEGPIDTLARDWLSFWFEPWRYCHPSWWQLLPVGEPREPSDYTLLRLGYREVCECLDLPPLWPTLPTEAEQHRVTRLAANLPHAHTLLIAFWDEGIELSEDDRQWVNRQKLATALARRFMEHEHDNGGRMTALWLLLQCLRNDFDGAWQRLRLVFPRQWVNALEAHNWSTQSVAWRLAVNQRVARRLSALLWERLITTPETNDDNARERDHA